MADVVSPAWGIVALRAAAGEALADQQLLHERLGGDLGAGAADGPIIDGFPIVVCSWRARCVARS